MGIIYCLTFPNNKKYVGQTKRTLTERLRDHNKKDNPCRLLREAFETYNRNFIVEILLEIEDDKLDEQEIYYIGKLKTYHPHGYNMTFGGNNGKACDITKKAISDGLKGHILSEETKKKISETHKKLEKTISPENREKINASISSLEVREKGSKNKKRYDNELPMYVHMRNHKKDPGYCVNIPREKIIYFTRRCFTMEEKKQMAINYLKDYYKNKEEKSND